MREENQNVQQILIQKETSTYYTCKRRFEMFLSRDKRERERGIVWNKDDVTEIEVNKRFHT